MNILSYNIPHLRITNDIYWLGGGMANNLVNPITGTLIAIDGDVNLIAQNLIQNLQQTTCAEEVVIDITQTKEGNYAHNSKNLGNFIWGAGAQALGFSLFTSRVGAHMHALKKHGELDSSDDQLSLKLGYLWNESLKK